MKLIFGIAVICASLIALSSGARYMAASIYDAERILDNSQGIIPVAGNGIAGNPRAYVLGVESGVPSDNSLQDFSRFGKNVTGFQLREEQNLIVHNALQTDYCRKKFIALNSGSTKEECIVQASQVISGSYLAVETWLNGEWHLTGRMKQVTIIMGHFPGDQNNADADVHIRAAIPGL